MHAPKSNRIYEISLKTDRNDRGQIELLKKVLHRQGIAENKLVESNTDGCTYLSFYHKDFGRHQKLRRSIERLRLKRVSLIKKSLVKEDWQTKWKADFKPFWMTPRIRVVPDWLKKGQKTSTQNIYIGAGLAFGTGMHATTRFMAGFIERCHKRVQRFLDVGTGTGILALAARQCGVNDVTAIDMSREAVRTAKANFCANGMTTYHLKAVGLKKFRPAGKYDFVAANLITHDLVDMKRKLVSLVKPGKYLAVSGISLNNYGYFRDQYANLPLRCLNIQKGEGWAACLFKRSVKG